MNLNKNTDELYELKWLVGTKQIEPVNYRLEEKLTKRWYWFDKKEYYIVCEFCKLGPLTLKEATYQLNIANHV